MKKKEKENQNELDNTGFTMPMRDRASFSTENRDFSQLDDNNSQGNYYDPQSQYNNPNYGGQDFQTQNQYYGGQDYGSQNQYSSGQGNGYQTSSQPVPPSNYTAPRHSSSDGRIIPSEYKPIGAWGYIGYSILFNLPCIGWILILVFSFGGTRNINVRNYARAMLIAWIIGIVCGIIAFAVGVYMGVTQKDFEGTYDRYKQNYYNSSDYPSYNDSDNSYGYDNDSDGY